MEGVVYTGVPSKEELENCPGVPGEARMRRGRVACIECVQQIPCNPCEGACKCGAITVGEQITNLPCLDEEKCTGLRPVRGKLPRPCHHHPRQIVFAGRSDHRFPFEYLPLPVEGDIVDAVSRGGETVCKGRILRVTKLPAYAGTAVIRMAVPQEHIDDVRSMKRLPRGGKEALT